MDERDALEVDSPRREELLGESEASPEDLGEANGGDGLLDGL